MRGFSTFWFESLFDGVGVIDIWSAFGRSIRLGLVVMVDGASVSWPDLLSEPIRMSGALFYATISKSDRAVDRHQSRRGAGIQDSRRHDQGLRYSRQITWVIEDFRTTMGLFSSGLGAQLTWTLPFGC